MDDISREGTYTLKIFALYFFSNFKLCCSNSSDCKYKEFITLGFLWPFVPVVAQVFWGISLVFLSLSKSTGSIIWPIIPSAKTITGVLYKSATSKASIIISTASWTDAGANTGVL